LGGELGYKPSASQEIVAVCGAGDADHVRVIARPNAGVHIILGEVNREAKEGIQVHLLPP